jgi:hypothetical protein
MFEKIPNPANRSPDVLPGLGVLSLLSIWEAEGCFRRAKIRVHRRTPFGDQMVTDSIGRAESESVFDAWERRLSEYISMKGQYIA